MMSGPVATISTVQLAVAPSELISQGELGHHAAQIRTEGPKIPAGLAIGYVLLDLRDPMGGPDPFSARYGRW
jgi:hypothetical protein